MQGVWNLSAMKEHAESLIQPTGNGRGKQDVVCGPGTGGARRQGVRHGLMPERKYCFCQVCEIYTGFVPYEGAVTRGILLHIMNR